MTSGHIDVFTLEGGQSTLASRFGLDDEPKALAFAEELYAGSDTLSIRVTMEVVDPGSGKTATNTILVRKREAKPPPKRAGSPSLPVRTAGKAPAEPVQAAATERPGAGAAPAPPASRNAGVVWDRSGNGAAPAVAWAIPAASAPRGKTITSAARPAPGRLALKGVSSAAGGGVVGLGTYAVGSALFGGALPHGTLVAGAVMGFVLGYFWLWRMLLTETEAGHIRALMAAWQPRAPGPAPSFRVAGAIRTPEPAPRLAAIEATPEPAAGGDKPSGAEPADEAFAINSDRRALVQEGFMTVIGFLHQSLAEVLELGRHAIGGRLDAYNAFGCHLFFAGACEGFARERRLEPGEIRWMLAEALGKIAFDAKAAGNFAQNYQEYLTQPNYLDAFKAGIDGIQAHLKGETPKEAALVTALDHWNRPEAKTAKTDFVVVLLTDLVGSTAFTQAHGDAANLDLVRAHNEIVRFALRSHVGREIKHTGDGIMAAFGSANEAVAAAIEIQRAVAEANRRDTAHAIHLRIGINAGEPIAEGDELYGSTVQIAQKVCAAGGADEIVVSAVVQGLAQGKNIVFRSLGREAVKGVAEPVELFAVPWR